MLSDDAYMLNDGAAQVDAETLSGGACTPPEALRSGSPTDSLFDSPRQLLKHIYHAGDAGTSSSHSSSSHKAGIVVATRTCPPIPGLHLISDLITQEQSSATLTAILSQYQLWDDSAGGRTSNNQVMLFGRARRPDHGHLQEGENEVEGARFPEPPSKRRKTDAERYSISTADGASSTGLPRWVDDLLLHLQYALHPHLPTHLHALLFPAPHPHSGQSTNAQGCTSRQVIINAYAPGQGISPHVDLLQRFGDGILIVSFLGGTVMDFVRVSAAAGPMEGGSGGEGGGDDAAAATAGPQHQHYAAYLPAGSVAVLHGPARYEWTHGIEGRLVDRVRPGLATSDEEQVELLPRGQRISVTIRWLLPGADVVGG